MDEEPSDSVRARQPLLLTVSLLIFVFSSTMEKDRLGKEHIKMNFNVWRIGIDDTLSEALLMIISGLGSS